MVWLEGRSNPWLLLCLKKRENMKGPREMKSYIAKFKKELKAGHWDDLAIFKFEKCKKWFKREKRPSKFDLQD